MRHPLEDMPYRNGLYATYVRNEDFAINGVSVNKQTSRDQTDGIWCRIVIDTVLGVSLDICSISGSSRQAAICDQSYKHFALVNYDSRVVIWANLYSVTIVKCFLRLATAAEKQWAVDCE